ncbi:MAG: MFS transporter, partial [Anaerolineales bacterium]
HVPRRTHHASPMIKLKPLQIFATQLRSFNPSARLFLLATVMDGIVYSAWSLFFNFYILGRGFERDYLGLVNAMPSIAALLMGIPVGMLSDRIGRKRAMLAGVGLSVVCMGLEVTVLDPTLILVMAFLSGTASMLYYLSQAPFMMKVSEKHNRTLLFSLNFGLVTLSGAVGNLFAGQLPSIFGNVLNVAPRSAAAYQAVLLLSVSMSLLTLIPLALIREPKLKPTGLDQVRPEIPLRKVLLRPLTLKLAAPNLMIGFGAAILIPYMNVFFLDRFSLPDKTLGLLFSFSALLTGIGSVIGPRVETRLGGKIRAVVVTQAASLAFLELMGFSPYVWLVSISFLLRGTLMNMAVPLYRTFTMEQVHEREQGTVNSIVELAWQVGWAVGPYLSGVVQEAYGFTPLFVTTGAMYASSILLTWVFFHKQEALKVGEVASPAAVEV